MGWGNNNHKKNQFYFSIKLDIKSFPRDWA